MKEFQVSDNTLKEVANACLEGKANKKEIKWHCRVQNAIVSPFGRKWITFLTTQATNKGLYKKISSYHFTSYHIIPWCFYQNSIIVEGLISNSLALPTFDFIELKYFLELHAYCCTLRNQFPSRGEIFLKTLMIIICCHLFFTSLFVVFLTEGPRKHGL